MKHNKLAPMLIASALFVLAACSPQQPTASVTAGVATTAASPVAAQAATATRPVATQAATAARPVATQAATATRPAATQAATTTTQAAATGVTIALGNPINITGSGATATANGVKITAPGTYTFSGVLNDGMIEVDAPGAAVELVLAGVAITNADGPAILVTAADEATLTLKSGTKNVVTDGGASDLDAAVYADTSLTIRGDGDLQVNGTVKEGIASTMHLTIEGGNIRVKSVEDGLNANNDGVSVITISDGYLFIENINGDGIDSNGDIKIDGGTIITQGSMVDVNAGLDADGNVTINGGTVIATGSSMLNKPAAASTVKSLLVTFNGTQPAGTVVSIQKDGTPMLVFAPSMAFQRLLYASDQVADGVTYAVYTGGVASGTPVDGLYTSNTYSGGSQVATVTTATAPARRPGRP